MYLHKVEGCWSYEAITGKRKTKLVRGSRKSAYLCGNFFFFNSSVDLFVGETISQGFGGRFSVLRWRMKFLLPPFFYPLAERMKLRSGASGTSILFVDIHSGSDILYYDQKFGRLSVFKKNIMLSCFKKKIIK